MRWWVRYVSGHNRGRMGQATASGGISKILVGTDGFGPASRAITKAAELAERHGARLVVLSAYQPPETDAAFQRGEGPNTEEVARGILDTVAKRYEGTKVRTIARSGDPAEVILDVAA